MSTIINIDSLLELAKPATWRFPLSISCTNEWVAFTAEVHGSKHAKIGVSSEVDGFTQWVCHMKTGRAFPVVPEATSSWSGTWSPDGMMLAFFSDLNGKAQLWLWNSENQSVSLASDAIVRPFFGFEKPIWTNDGNAIIVKAMPQGYVNNSLFNSKTVPSDKKKESAVTVFSTDMYRDLSEEVNDSQSSFIERYHADIIRIDWRENKHTVIAFSHRPVGIALSEDGQNIAFTSCNGLDQINQEQVIYDLWIAPVYPAGPKQEYCLQKNTRMAYGLSFTWGKNDKTIYYTTEGPLANGGLWSIHIDEVGQSKKLFQQDNLRLDRDYEAPYALPNGDLILVAAGKLWRYSYENCEMIELSSQIQKRIVTFIPAAINIGKSMEEQSIIVQTRDEEAQKWGLALINLESGKVEQSIEGNRKMTPWPLGREGVSSSNNASNVVYISESASEAANLWNWDLQTNETLRLTDLTSIPAHSTGVTKILTWKIGEQEAKGILLLPQGLKDKVPVLLDVYAGEKLTGSFHTFGLHDSPVDNRHLFSSRGYAVFIPELPINSHEPAAEIEKGLIAALDELAKYPELDMNRLGIMGHSFGGYTTLVAITRLPDRFKAAIFHSGIGNLISHTTHFDPAYYHFNYDWTEHGQANLGVSIWENKERYIRNSPIFDFEKIKSPLLIIQGTKDPICAHEAGPIFSALKRLNKTAELVLYEDEDHGHGTWSYENIKDYYGRVFGWLEKYLL